MFLISTIPFDFYNSLFPKGMICYLGTKKAMVFAIAFLIINF